MTQCEKVLRHLNELGEITSWEAITEYGITRLSAIIYLLKKEGQEISASREYCLNGFGEQCSFARYKLEKK